MTVVTETLQVSGIRCERCVMRLSGVLQGHDGLESANATLMGHVTFRTTTNARPEPHCSTRWLAAVSASSSLLAGNHGHVGGRCKPC